MAIELTLKEEINKALKKLGVVFETNNITIDHSKDPSHGDYASNIAFKVNKDLGPTPIETANKIIEALDKKIFNKVEVAKPGFINFFLKSDLVTSAIEEIVRLNKKYGAGEKKEEKINIEFVSANPTGHLHVGHARCAAYGDSLARIMEFAGYQVTREYYINDAGNQIANLGESIYQRYIELFGEKAKIPEDGYMGEDVKEIAKSFKQKYGNSLLEHTKENLNKMTNEGKALELENIKKDLELFRVKFDVYSSETTIRNSGAIEKALKELEPHIYVDGGAKILRTTEYLDDKDRPIVKSNGDYTYFLPDIAYHYNKLSRGFDYLIDVLGADHHGYVNRMKSALMMKGYKKETLDVPLVQVVRLMDKGLEVKMSKRTGNAITLRELCEEVGVDAVRYFFVARSNTSHLDFDYAVAKSKTNDNPVYYAMYAHARLHNVLELAKGMKVDYSGKLLKEKAELDILKTLQEFPHVIQTVAKSHEVHKLTIFIHSLATLIHSFYNECRIVNKESLELTANRLGLVEASKIVLYNALSLIGVNAPDKM
ncbi:MAG: arginine--tRNA ligase [Bacilli bacterium]|nr:arginine--tRNA ligase [Bacilli bacterium]